MCVTAAFRGMRSPGMPVGSGVGPLADIPYRECRDGPSELVIRRKHPVVAMPVLPRRRHEVGEPVEELKRREFDDAVGPRPGGLAAAAPPDPVGGFVPWQDVADLGCAAAARGTTGSRGDAPAR